MSVNIGGLVGGGVGGLLGNILSQGDQNNSNQSYQNALAQYLNLQVPTIAEQQVTPENYTLAGSLTPSQESAVTQGNSLLNNITTDPRLQGSQMQALQALTGIANGQMTPADQAAFQLARNDSAAETQAKQKQILQNMQARGAGGSGAELLARLTGAQAGAQQLSNADMQQAQAIQQAKMAALNQQANLSTSMRGQDYEQQANAAKAQDAINQFNAQNASSSQARNVASQNAAQQYNLTNAQNINNNNTQGQNQAQYYNKGLYQTQFGDNLAKANGAAGQYTNIGKNYGQQAQNTQNEWAGIGQAAGTAATVLGG